ncbi:MAG TPA: hypothetical protein VGX71_02365 [Pseudaminobacter sp.]|jgi:hypothetical protein|nr:hypothetical protein [Pseudaminobacter sp.]
MVAEMQRLENAARIAMGDVQAPAQNKPQPRLLPHASAPLVAAVLAMVGFGLIAIALI